MAQFFAILAQIGTCIARLDLTKVAPAIKAFLDLLTLLHDKKYAEAVVQLDVLIKAISGLIPAADHPQVVGTLLDASS